MGYLLDTNVISEVTRSRPAPQVIAWLNRIPNEEQYLSVLTIGELRYGIEKKTNGNQGESLRLWFETEVLQFFSSRLLPVSVSVADRWARLRIGSPRSLPAIDSLFAATALSHDLRFVTRNSKDFEGIPGLVVVNPWKL